MAHVSVLPRQKNPPRYEQNQNARPLISDPEERCWREASDGDPIKRTLASINLTPSAAR